MAGFSVLPGEAAVAPLCGAAADCAALLLSDAQYATLLLGRRLGWAREPEQLEREWSRALRNGVVPDQRARDTYERKKRHFAGAAA
jgi:hypothetical protein